VLFLFSFILPLEEFGRSREPNDLASLRHCVARIRSTILVAGIPLARNDGSAGSLVLFFAELSFVTQKKATVSNQGSF
jgi:hypothetical protein